MRPLRQLERVEWRALGAWRCIDGATGIPVIAPLDVIAPAEAEIIRNRSGLYIVNRHAALASHSNTFALPPASPPLGSVTLAVAVPDPAGFYLARTAEIRLPRDARPENAGTADSLFNPVSVELYRSPAAPLGANWVALRVSLTEQESGDALGGALLRVRSNGRTLARGLSDWRGEALVPVVGVPITTWSEDENTVVATAIDATLEVFFDPTAGGVRTPAAQIAAGRAPTAAPAPDPQRTETNPAAARTQAAIRLATGQPLAMSVTLDLSD
jgi:hypothetical protein